MKKILLFILTFTLCFTFTSCGQENSADETGSTGTGIYDSLEPVNLIGADSTGKGAAGQIFGEYIAERVSEITDGKLTMDYFPNGELGGDADLIRQMQAGDIDMVVCQTAPMVSFIPEMAVFDLPMAFTKLDGDAIDEVLNGENEFSEAMKNAYENANLHLLGFLQNATYRLTTANTPLNTLDDFAKLQIRTMENSNHMTFWKAIGAEPTPLAWGEVYIALKNGTIDAEENAADTCLGANFQEVQKYLACTNHILYCNQVCINSAKFSELDPLYQDAINQAVKEASEYVRPMLENMDAECKEALASGGMTIIEYDDEFYDQVLGIPEVQKLYEDIDKNQVNGLGTLLMDQLGNRQ